MTAVNVTGDNLSGEMGQRRRNVVTLGMESVAIKRNKSAISFLSGVIFPELKLSPMKGIEEGA